MERSFQLLVVEDNPADSHLIQHLISKTKFKGEVNFIQDGETALDYLFRRGPYLKTARPHLVLLDLNLPGVNGFEVLKRIKTDKSLQSIPVVVLTTSDRQDDVTLSYQLQANAYLVKPGDLKSFEALIQIFSDHWLNLTLLPEADG
jgi:CheY-like chemotaxis protein